MSDKITITEYKIDKTTYIVEAHSSENARYTLKEKVNKLIIRDLHIKSSKIGENPHI